MTKLNTLLVLSTALALVAPAALGDDNKSFIEQVGERNTALVTQSGILHEAGSDGKRMSQQGKDNRLVVTQTNAGTGNIGGNVAGTSGLGIDQIGNFNELRITQADQKNAVRQVQQISTTSSTALSNDATIYQNHNARVSRILQKNESVASSSIDINRINVRQLDTWNKIGTLTGFDDTIGLEQVGSGNDMVIDQLTGSNEIKLAKQTGLRNSLTVLQDTSTSNKALTLLQHGHDNEVVIGQRGSSNVVTTLSQTGNNNVATISQTGSGNGVTTITQSQDGNILDLIQNGVGNKVSEVSQSGGNNTANLEFQGDGNGDGSFSSGFDNRGLTQGQVLQANTNVGLNLIEFTVHGSDNLFAFKQAGTGNTISGGVGSASNLSSLNQVAVLQTGNNNHSHFTQIGTSNSASVSQ